MNGPIFTKKPKLHQVLVLGVLLLFTSIFLPLTDFFSQSASAAVTDQQCYAFSGRVYPDSGVWGVDEAELAIMTECVKAGYCEVESDIFGKDLTCSENVYKNSPQQKAAETTELIWNAQVAPVITKICGSIPQSGASTGELRVYEECSSKIKERYKLCANNAEEGSPTEEQIVSAIASCIKSGYPTDVSDEELKLAVSGGREGAADQVRKQQEAEEGGGEVQPICGGGALAWILCPLTTVFQESITMLAGMSQSFMHFEPLIGSRQGDAVLAIWRMVVSIANLFLVIAFLVVIFSQATSVGLSAYGIKKMLPRIILAAILLNISFYICAAAVDITNIIGASVQGIIGSASNAIQPPPGSPVRIAPDFGPSVAAMVGLMIVPTTIAAMTGALGFVVPILLTALVSMFFLFIVLAMRHVLTILLVAISPLAFAAMILPNTDGLFKKWWKAFYISLILYPVIMALAYGSMLVSKIILLAAPSDFPESLVWEAFAFVVLFAWIWALKFIVTWGGGLAGRIAGKMNDPNKGLIDKSKNWAKGRRAERKQYNHDRMVKGLSGLDPKNPLRRYNPAVRKIARQERNRQAAEEGKLGAARIAAQHYTEVKGGATTQQKAQAQAVLDELDMKEAKIKLDFVFNGNAQDALNEALRTKDGALLKLSAGKMVDNAKLQDVQEKMETSMDSGQVQSVSRYLMNNHFAKVKEQDLGMMYALPELSGEAPIRPSTVAAGATDAKGIVSVLRAGGSEYDGDAMRKASDQGIGTQEYYALDRQRLGGVLTIPKAERILDDDNLKGVIKTRQRNVLETTARRPLTP